MAFSRRDMLKHASLGTSAALFTPFFNSVAVHAAGNEAALPKRFVFIVKASGIDKHNLVPTSLSGANTGKQAAYAEKRDRLVNVKWQEDTLPDVFKPLSKMKDRITVIQGLSGNNLKGNHTAGYGTLSCHNSERTAVAPSVDALLGLKHSTGPYPIFGMATNGALLGQASIPEDSYVYPNISALKAGQGVAFQASPTKAFNELFGSAVMSQAELKKETALKRNLMDFLKDDAKRINKRLSKDDRERFAGYVDTFDSLRRREEKKVALKDRVAKNKPNYVKDKYTSMQHMDRMAAQFELGTAAIVAGLTNVITLRPDTLGTLYGGLGFGPLGLHQIGHGATSASGMTSSQMRKKTVAYHMDLIAKMAKRFDALPEGNGTMLDNTLIVYLSCAGGKHHGGNTDWPAVLVGGCNKTLNMGRYLQYPSYQTAGHKTIANLYMSLLQAGGVSYGQHFGQSDPQLRDFDTQGPLAELLV